MKEHRLLKSSTLVETSAGSILLGVPSDILKKIGASKDLDIPTILVQPDFNHFEGISQFSPEFPLYYFLFVGKNLFKKKFKLLLKDEKHKEKEAELLTHMLLGPPLDYLIANGLDEDTAKKLRKEMDYIAIKKDDIILNVSDMIEFIVPDNDNGYTIEDKGNSVRINRLGDNNFEIIEEDIKLKIELESEKELPIKVGYQLSSSYIPPVFGLVNLGSRSGFDPDSYTTTMILSINGVMGLIDGSAYLMYQLDHFGLSFEDIKFIFLTHTHDDHCNLTPIVYKTAKTIPIVTTKEIYESALLKVRTILDDSISKEDFRKQFPLVEIKAGYDKEGEPVNFLGATVIAHRTIHSIPCIGFTIKLQDKTLFISGDTLSPKKINEFLDKGIIEKERAEYLINKLNGNYTRALIDGGGGLIHGDPDEFKPRRGLHIVHVNPNMLKNTLHNLLDSGQSLVLIEAKMLNENISYEITKILTSMGISPYDPWMKIFINSGKLVFSQQYEFLALEGEKDFSGLFLVLGGEVEVLTGKKPITKFRRGTYFGELALLEDKRGIRQANIRISSITALLWEIPGEVFQSYVKYSGKKSSFYRIRNAIQRIEAMPVFKGLGGEAITTLARQSEAKFYYEGQIIFKSTPVYFIVFLNEGKLHLVKDGKVLKEFIAYENGTDIDISEIINSYENARLIAKSFVELTLINKKVYHKILDEYTGMGNFRRK